MKLQFGSLEINESVIFRLFSLGYTVESLQEAIETHSDDYSGVPAVYCGTYSKYNDGDITGLWIDITSFDCYEDFHTFCLAIHADEADPELMYQDFCGFPREFYNESFLDDVEFDQICQYHRLAQAHGREAVDDFLDCGFDLEDFDELYCGEWNSEIDFTYDFVDNYLDLDNLMGGLAAYFDYESYSRDLFISDYLFGSNGHVFRRA